MRNSYSDPNQEVESWKDALYDEFKKAPKSDLVNYFEKEADRVLKKNNIKSVSTRIVKKPEFAKT